MQKMIRAFFISLFLMISFNANSSWFGGNDCPPWAYDCNDWPEWTPMYWMEEMSDEFDDNNWGGNNWGGNNWGPFGGYNNGPWGGPGPYGPPPMYGPGPGGPGGPYGAPPMYGPGPYGAPPMPPMYGPGPYGAPPVPQAPPAPAR